MSTTTDTNEELPTTEGEQPTNTTPEVQPTPEEGVNANAAWNEAILKVSDAQAKLREVNTLTEAKEKEKEKLEKDIEVLELNKKALEEENTKKFKENNTVTERDTSQLDSLREDVKNERAALEKDKADFQVEKDALQKRFDEFANEKKENERIKEEIVNEKAKLDSLIAESKRMSDARATEIETAEKAKNEAIQEQNQSKVIRDALEKETLENRAILERIELSKKGAEESFDLVRKERQEMEQIKTIAQQEVNAAEFAKMEAHKLVLVFRQALQTFIQVNGLEVRVPEVTEADKRFIIKDLIEQCPTFDYATTFPDRLVVVEEKETVETPSDVTPTVENQEEIVGGNNDTVDNSGATPEEVMKSWEKMSKPKLTEIAKTLLEIELNQENTQKEMVEIMKNTYTSKLAAENPVPLVPPENQEAPV